MTPDPSAGAPRITRETRGHVLLIGLNRPAKKNAFDLPMLAGLAEAFAELDRSAELRSGVVFAHGGDFTAGLDLGNVASALAQGGGLAPAGGVDPFAVAGPACSKPVVCAVQGLCLTAGIELMLACDVVVAADDARFGQIEIKRGLFPFGGGTWRWVQTCGWGNAMRYLLTGDMLDAATALRLGLVQEVVAPDRALPRAIELAETIAAQAPLGVMATLRSARKALAEGPEAAARELMPELSKLMQSEDVKEGLQSFLERRAGRFTGR
jgi:enoyl-CoA hydratase/carnithine racemase